MCFKLQLQALKEMKNAYPKGVWNGDADLGDGTLQVLRTENEETMKHIKNLTSPKKCG